MSNIKKFAYTTGNIFTLTGGNYIGYYNIYNNTPYVGKYTQDTQLTNVHTAYNAVACSDLFFNRLPGENFSLTYTLSDFIFQPGEFINSNSVDTKLSKMFTNFLDTYRACFMASSDLPNGYGLSGVVSATNAGLNFAYIINSNFTNTLPLSVLNSQLTRDAKLAYSNNTYSNNDTLVIANSSVLYVYGIRSTGTNTFTFVFSSQYVETNTPDYGSLMFNNITNLALYGTNLYICDTGAATVYTYDITNVLNEDNALGYKFNLVTSLNSTEGGFITPELITASSTTLYVYDSTSQTIFFYDTNNNLINTYKNEIFFSQSQPVSLTYYEIYDQLFVLTSDFKILILNNDGTVNITSLFLPGLITNEVARKLVFANVNSDVFYVLSNFNLYKFYVSNMSSNIGSFSFSQYVSSANTDLYANPLLYDLAIAYSDTQNYDNMVLYGFDKIIHYNETLNVYSIIK